MGHAVFSNVINSKFQGKLYAVNPKPEKILGFTPFTSVSDIPEQVDLAVIVTPREVVGKVLEECGKKNIHAAVIITAGFREIGGEGIELEKRVIEVANRYEIALVGPNCLGVINTSPDISLNASFASSAIKPGTVAFISQSGAMGVAALDYAQKKDFGFSKFVSIGNKATLSECDVLEYLKDDPETKLILVYLEDLQDPKRFLELAKEVTAECGKPILAIKSGRTNEGQKAASSHTGALSGSDEMVDSLFIQSGVVRIETLEELFDSALAFANQPIPKGNRVAIITNAGGPGIMSTDACIRYGLKLSSFSQKTETSLRTSLPITANIKNPIDVIGDAGADRYGTALEAVLNDESVDGIIVICTPQLMTDMKAVVEIIIEKTRGCSKPVFCSFMSLSASEKLYDLFDEANIPNYPFPESCARVFSLMTKYAAWTRRPRTDIKVFTYVDKEVPARIIQQVLQEKRHFLMETEAYEILSAYGFPLAKYRLAKNIEEAVTAGNEIGYPVVLKIASPDIFHKTEVGGVLLNIKDKEELKKAYTTLTESVQKNKPEARITGVMVLEFVTSGAEIILGMNRDPHFGPLLMFGMGGIYTEVYKDVTFRFAPIHELSADHMIETIKGYPILKGARAGKEYDIDTIADLLKRLSQLVIDFPAIRELDINPLKVFHKGQGAKIVDARILIG